MHLFFSSFHPLSPPPPSLGRGPVRPKCFLSPFSPPPVGSTATVSFSFFGFSIRPFPPGGGLLAGHPCRCPKLPTDRSACRDGPSLLPILPQKTYLVVSLWVPFFRYAARDLLHLGPSRPRPRAWGNAHKRFLGSPSTLCVAAPSECRLTDFPFCFFFFSLQVALLFFSSVEVALNCTD